MTISPKFLRFLQRCVVVLSVLAMLTPDAALAARHKHGRKQSRSGVSTAAGVSDPRYADIIMDPITGEVFHAVDPDERRYPASLTKMMTLYLLFEALANHKTSMDARLDISEKATTMPQTNLALSAGDSIPVEVAIKALIVRSANDVAWVVGEALGGDIDHFADMMTAKARQLGMRNTVFQNPNGLPNDAQYTTARDMAKLGIALKRDFPQYYPLFQTRQFSWEGVTYYTHNRVMLRYTGTDGIKTGYIGKSGFNLVTSVVRGGRPLVGVVMGGSTGAWRDNRMIQLLDATYGTIASRGGKRGKIYAANLPLNKAGKPAGLGGVITVAAPAEAADATLPDGGAEDGAPAAELLAEPAPAMQTPPAVATAAVKPQTAPAAALPTTVKENPKPVSAPVAPAPVPPASPDVPATNVTPVPAPASLPPGAILHPAPGGPVVIVPKPAPAGAPPKVVALPPASKTPVSLANSGGGAAKSDLVWGIQVGAFSSHELAEQASVKAKQVAATPLKDARIAVIGPTAAGAAVHRARLENLSQLQARKACEALISNNSPCFIYHLGRDGL